MILSVTVTAYWVVGLKIDLEDYSFKEFMFTLPFPHFRDTNTQYWAEVIEYIYSVTGCNKDSTKLLICTEDETLLKSDLVAYSSKISTELTDMNLPVSYIGESKGFVDGVVYPLVINPVDFYRWFNLAEDINQVENHFYNRSLYGIKVPTNSWDFGFEESLYREKLTFLYENIQTPFLSKSKNIILMGEGTFFVKDDKKILLSFLDSLNINGFWRVYFDNSLILLNLHLLKKYDSQLGDNIYKNYKLKDLGGCLLVQNALKASLKFTDGTEIKLNLEPDSISVVPLNKETKVEVKVTFLNKKEQFFSVDGGEYGLAIDNRVRPLLQEKSSKQREITVSRWLKEISSNVDLDSHEKHQEVKIDEIPSLLKDEVVTDKSENKNEAPKVLVDQINMGFENTENINKVEETVKNLEPLEPAELIQDTVIERPKIDVDPIEKVEELLMLPENPKEYLTEPQKKKKFITKK